MVVNETINATINATAERTLGEIFSHYFPILKERALALILAPAGNPEMLWIVFPLAVSLLFMTLYFGRYKLEELGWNTAFGNSLALLFVAVDLFRQIVHQPEHLNLLRQGVVTAPLFVPLTLLVFAFFLLLSNFFHILPKFFAFFISSALPINLLAYVGIVVVYTGFPFDWITLISAFILFLLLMIALAILRFFEPEDWSEKQQALIDDMLDKHEKKKGKT